MIETCFNKITINQYIGYGALFLFLIVWEVPDLFWLSSTMFFVFNIVWGLYIIANNSDNINESENRNLPDNSPKINQKVNAQNILPLYFFFKNNIVFVLITVVTFNILQDSTNHPIKNLGITLFGKQLLAKIAEDSSEIISEERGIREVYYQIAKFDIKGNKYEASYFEDFELDARSEVMIEYLPLNPSVNRFRIEFINQNNSKVMYFLKLIFSFLIPLVFLLNLEGVIKF